METDLETSFITAIAEMSRVGGMQMLSFSVSYSL
ncbi:hypothetical protein ES708_07960 [subsurface metagenome]